jgi:hypothetical protein
MRKKVMLMLVYFIGVLSFIMTCDAAIKETSKNPGQLFDDSIPS